jgi:hypothetical protein
MSDSSVELDLPQCRICFENDIQDNLFRPCKCNGSLKWVHEECLTQWRISSIHKHKCEICGHLYKCENVNTNNRFYKVNKIISEMNFCCLFLPIHILIILNVSLFVYIINKLLDETSDMGIYKTYIMVSAVWLCMCLVFVLSQVFIIKKTPSFYRWFVQPMGVFIIIIAFSFTQFAIVFVNIISALFLLIIIMYCLSLRITEDVSTPRILQYEEDTQ